MAWSSSLRPGLTSAVDRMLAASAPRQVLRAFFFHCQWVHSLVLTRMVGSSALTALVTSQPALALLPHIGVVDVTTVGVAKMQLGAGTPRDHLVMLAEAVLATL